MKLLKYYLFSLSLLFAACTSSANDGNKFPEFNKDEYKIIHQLYGQEKNIIGAVYAKYLDDVFTSLVIIDEEREDNQILYYIDRTRFINADGIEFEIEENDNNKFYGYKVALLGQGHIVVYYLSNGGQDESDNITIEWNNEEKKFKKYELPF